MQAPKPIGDWAWLKGAIVGANEQVPGRRRRHLRSARPYQRMQSGKGRTLASHSALLNLPRLVNGWGFFCLDRPRPSALIGVIDVGGEGDCGP
jgi:hypothetical protein